ncbi:hypothetical protein [Maribacter sp. 2307ULW6-5]|uniref:hypothetical protein n=1 Tax=Maribacter sp. 2307ULW6-5 TaxID=3386275 RepID=UPI0039BD6764
MKKFENYTDGEWDLVASLPQLVGVVMAGADSSGIVGSSKEMFANARGMMAAKQEYGGNPLIQALLPDTSSPSAAMEDAKEQRKRVMGRFKASGAKSSEELRSFVLADCKKAVQLLEKNESATVVAEYKKMVLDLAEKVANAAKEGDFLGFGGVRFSEKEQQLFEELKEVLA